jgi:hypothetical protein
MKSKKLLSLLGAAGVVVHAATLTHVPAHASASNAQLESILQQDPTSDDATAAFDTLASRFKPPGDHGRPDLFGPPGPPEIGPPGHYQG